MEEQLKVLREELWLSKECEEKLLHDNNRLSSENEEMQGKLREFQGTEERVEEGVEMRMRENEEQVEAVTGQVMEMMKMFMGEGAVGGVVSASGNGLIVKEKAKVSNNRESSDSDNEDKGIRHNKNAQKCNRKNEKKGKSNVKREKKKGQDESEDDHEWVKVVR
ncbi:DNA ligase 1-like [Palaemon carinicauda]|uniref:DNA ligase 1-like n=1 Tax=Palaemon carinicauda TaxID=392227 RepID=UPI0035B5B8B7